VVVFEASKGDALPSQDDEVKHYDTDSACAFGNIWAHYSGICIGVLSVLTKVIVYWHWDYCH
jgi:hypothetical protein